MKRKERFFGILLSLVLMLMLMAGMSLSAHAETSYDVWVGGVQVTSANRGNVLAGDPNNDGKVSFAPAEGTAPAILTLDGATITSGSYRGAAIYAGGDLTIEVAADSTVTGPEADESYGIYSLSSLTFTGTGELTAAGGKAKDYSIGVIAEHGSVTVNGTLTAEGSSTIVSSFGVWAYRAVTVNGTLTAEGGEAMDSYGVWAYGSVTVNGTLTAEGGTATGNHGDSYGVRADGAVTVNGTLTAAGNTQAVDGSVENAVAGTGWTNAAGTEGKANIEADDLGQSLPSYKKVQFPALYDVWVGGVQVTGANMGNVLAGDPNNDGRVSFAPATETTPATLTLDGATITSGSYNYAAIYADGDLTVNVTANSTVTGPEAKYSYGIYARSGSLTITGTGTLTAEGGTATGNRGDSYGVFVFDGSVTVAEGGTLTAAGSEAGGMSFGVSTLNGDVTVAEGGELTATGGTSTEAFSSGVYVSGGAVTVNGKLTAEGGTATLYSLGVSADSVTVNGTLTAAGGTSTYNFSCGVLTSKTVTVNGTLIASGGTATNGTSYGVSANKGVIVDTGAKLSAAGGTQAISGSVKNAVAGTGWTNAAGTEGMAIIAANEQGQTLNNYKKVQFPGIVLYPVWVGGVQVTELNMDNVLAGDPNNDGKVSFAPAEGITPATLTLSGATITSGSHNYAAIYAEGDLTVNVTADSTVTGPEANYSYGVYSDNSLTVTGTGTLTAEGGTATGNRGDSYGVFVFDGSVTVAEGGTLTATGGTADGMSFGVFAFNGGVTVAEGGELTAAGGESQISDSYGVWAYRDVTVNGTLTGTGGAATNGDSCGVYAGYGAVTVNGTLTAEGGAATNGDSCGVWAYGDVTVNGTLTAAGGTQAIRGKVKNAIAGTGWTDAAGTEGKANIAANEQGQNLSNYKKVQFPALYDVWVGGVQVTSANMGNVLAGDPNNDGKVSFAPAEGTTPATLTLSGATITGSYNDAAIYAEGDLTIDVTADSTVTGPDNVSGNSCGIGVSGSLTVTGTGKLTAAGGAVTTGNSYGVWSNEAVTVAEGGTLTAEGGEAYLFSYGIFAERDITVNGTVTATGGESGVNSCGVFASGAVTVNGTLTATGGEATYSYGVWAYGAVTVNGTLTAEGGTAYIDSCGVLTSGAVTVNGTLIASGGSTTNGASYGVSANKGVIVDTGAKLTATGNTQAIDGSVKNAIAGTGWTNTAGTEGKANIAADDLGQTLDDYKKVQFPALYDVWVGGVQVTGANMDNVLAGDPNNDGRVSFAPAEGTTPATLTLDGATITSGSRNYAAIYAGGDLTVNVTADSTVTGPRAGNSYGVYNIGGSLTVTGAGTLTAAGSTAMDEYGASRGVWACGDVTVNGTLTAEGSSTNGTSFGVYAYGSVTVNGTLTAEGSSTNGTSFGVYAFGSVTVNGTLTGTGGTATNGDSCGVFAFDVTVNGTLIAEGDTQAISGSVRNAIAGTGWTNTAGTEGMAIIAANDQVQTLNNYKKVRFPGIVLYPVWVGGVQVTELNMGNVLAGDSVNNGRVSFAPATETTPATLTLDGATITSGSYRSAAIYAGGDLTIEVAADSTVTGPETDDSYGVINSGGSLTVTGSGKLTATGGKATYGASYGVFVFDGSVTVAKGAKLTAAGGAAKYADSCGVFAYGVYVYEGGTLTAEGSSTNGYSYGVLTSETVTVNGTLIASGGTATNGASLGVSANKGVIVDTGAKLTAAGGTQAVDGSVENAVAGTGWTNAAGTEGKANIDVSAGARPLPNYRKVQFPALYDVWVGGVQATSANMNDVLGTVDGDDATVIYTPATDTTPATLTLSGAEITSGSYRSAAIYVEGDLTINVTADSTVTGPEADYSYGVYSGGSLTVTGTGKLTAEGGTAKSGSYGVIAANGSVTVNGTLTATGGTLTAEGESYGVWALNGAVTVNGTLTAEGGTATGMGDWSDSYGVSSVDITVNATGKLTATGGTAKSSSYGVNAQGAVTVNGTMNATGGTANDYSYGVFAFNGGVTVAEGGTLTATGGAADSASFGVFITNGAVTVAKGGTLTAVGGTWATNATVKNAIAGTGWTDAAGTEGQAFIPISTEGQTLDYKRLQFPAVGYSVAVIPGSNMTKTKDSGAESQNGLTGAMTDVVYTADDGYYFPDGYSVAAVNGISVTRNSYTQITVSGTPTANAEITLTAPTAKTDQTAPTGLTAAKASSSTAADGKISGVTSAMEYQKDGDTAWTAVGENQTEITGLTAGTYKVRYAGTADKNASPAASVEVGAKTVSTVTKAPTAKTLTYSGQAQELVTAGTAEGGEMRYALGSATEATESYTASIPSGTDAVTYYVWYMVVGDANHNDTEAAKVTVTISKDTVTAPTIASKEYTGQTQTADVAASTLYTVTANNGGTNVGSYDVVLTLTDSANYKWTDSTAAAKTLSFQITKAPAPAITVPTPDAVTYDPEKKLSDISLSNGWAWVTDTTVPTVGNSGYAAALSVDDENYNYTGVQGYDANTRKVTRIVSLTVNKATVTAPTIASKEYTGETQTADVAASTLYTVTTNNGGTIVGSYDVVLTLTDSANYKWSDSTEAAKTLSFQIIKATANTVTVNIEGWTYGEAAKAPTSTATFGTAAYTYADKGGTDFSATVPTTAGNYTVKATVAGTANYPASEATADFTIAKASITPTVSIAGWTVGETANTPSVSGNTGNGAVTYSYAAKGSTDFSAAVPTNAGEYTVKASIAATANYNAAEATADFTIAKLIPMAGVDFSVEALQLTYTGSPQKLVRQTILTDGLEIEYSLDYGASVETGLPMKKASGVYQICYRVIGNETYASLDWAGPVTATIRMYATFGEADFVLPPFLIELGEEAFAEDTAITTVDASGCAIIDANAFRDCTNLKRIRLSQNCEIDDTAFAGCVALKIFAPAGGTAAAWCASHDINFVAE